MRFEVGEIIYNTISREEGRILRIADRSLLAKDAYVVLIRPSPNWNMTAREAIWPESEVKQK
jgi:hypothetical protein